jgi:outer membrane protein assembly factor BamB
MTIFRSAVGLVITALLVSAGAVRVSNRTPEDWPQWRGPNRDGVSTEKGLLKSWPEGGPPLAWKASGAGAGYSSFAIADGRLFTMGARGDTEYVIAFDTGTGKRLWETPNGQRYSNGRGDGPRGTPTVDGNVVYAYGANGDLGALDATTGKVIWQVNVLKQFGGSNIEWGMSESPLVLSDRILVNAGGRGASIVALKKTDGSLIWKSQSDPAGYSSAVVHKLGDISQAIFFTATRALGIDVISGRVLWDYKKVANAVGANIATPIVRGNRVFFSSGYDTGGALLELTPDGKGVRAREVYFTRAMMNHPSSSVLVGDHLYGFDNGILTAMKFDTGEVAWQDRSIGNGSLVFADERLYLFSDEALIGLVEASPTGYRQHGRLRLWPAETPSFAHPVVSGGKFYARAGDVIFAFDVRAK